MKRSRGNIQHGGLRDMRAVTTLFILFSASISCLMTFTGMTTSQACDQFLRKWKLKKMFSGNTELQLLITVTTMSGSSAVAYIG